MSKKNYDAVIIGSGPNGLAAAISLAKTGLSVAIFEAKETIGGGLRSTELTLPGFIHDICAAVHPLGVGSPFFRSLPLEKYGLEWIYPPVSLAHPFDAGQPALLHRSIDETSQTLGIDANAYRKLMQPLAGNWDLLVDDLLAPFHIPRHPIALASFGYYGLRSAESLMNSYFQGEKARSMFAGLAAHAILPLDNAITASFGLILGILGHKIGWPIAKGGSQQIAKALGAYFQDLGGEIITGVTIKSLKELPPTKAVLCDIGPRQLLQIANDRLPEKFQEKLRKYRYGPGVFKIDWALNAPIPWKEQACQRAGTIHLGSTAEEIILSEKKVWEGEVSQKPYIILAQPSLFDATRAPEGKHTAWAYCHVPSGSEINMIELIENQIERFAPTFRKNILARHTYTAVEMEHYNPNYIGGDINGGVQDIYQLFTRPTARIVPYSTPIQGLYICSASTPPGGGVHGMCGYHAAQAALKSDIFTGCERQF